MPRRTKRSGSANARPAPVFPIGNLPTEIQHMIWGFVFDRPACHTFRMQKRYQGRPGWSSWHVVIKPQRKGSDNSTYHLWKKLHSLKNISFEKAFRSLTKTVRSIELEIGSSMMRPAAAMDAATDLIIFDFHRGAGEVAFDWHEHIDMMDIDNVRHNFRDIRKVAIHYKDTHPSCITLCPFMCSCPTTALRCKNYSHCPFEVACFLDIFPDLEEFHLVVEQRLVVEKSFGSSYKPLALRNGLQWYYRPDPENQQVVKTYNLSRFSDLRFEYIELVPNDIAPTIKRQGPFAQGEAARLLNKIKSVYVEDRMAEPFLTSQAQRQAIKFGILISYEIEK